MQIMRQKTTHIHTPTRTARLILCTCVPSSGMRSRVFLEPMCRTVCACVCFARHAQRVQRRVCVRAKSADAATAATADTVAGLVPPPHSDLKGGENIEILSCSTRPGTCMSDRARCASALEAKTQSQVPADKPHRHSHINTSISVVTSRLRSSEQS